MKISPAEPEEFAFVFDSWARSFQKSPFAGCIPNNIYPQVSRAASAEIIDRGAQILVAHVELPEGGRRVMGYSVSEPAKQVLHWLFVKKDYRQASGLRIGSLLLAATAEGWTEPKYTYRTRASAKFLGPTWKWCPELARIKG